MRLEVDLRFDATARSAVPEGDAERLDLNTLARAARSPLRLWRLLRRNRYAEVTVIEGPLRLSSVQAACLLFVCAIPTRRLVVNGQEIGRSAFIRRSAVKALLAIVAEPVRTAVLLREVQRSAARSVALPRRADAISSVLYVRADPTLSWMGVQAGGASTHTAGVVNGLIDNGVSVEILAAERPIGTDRAGFVQVPVGRVLQLVPGVFAADYGRAIAAAGADRPAQFVYERYQLGSTTGRLLAERLGVPLVLEFNGSEIWIEKHWSASGHIRFGSVFERLEHRNLVDASLVVVVSEALREIAVELGARPESVLVNPNGVDIDALVPYREGSPAEWRTRMGLADSATVGFVGTFGPWHGVTLLPALIELVPNARWVLIGDGHLFAEVREEIEQRGLSDRVTLTGLVPRLEALQLLACCDVCVSPHVPNPDGSEFFGSPTKLFEYMGLRKAIVASDLAQIGEVLTNEKTALLVSPGDVDDTAAAIRRLLADESLREEIAVAALDLAASTYSWTAHVRRILDAAAADSA